MAGFTIRAATVDDLVSIADGFAAVSGMARDRARARIDHAMRGNPFGFSAVVAVDVRGAIVGHLGVTHVPVNIQGEVLTFGRFLGCWLDLMYRAGGIHSPFVEMDRTFSALFEETKQVAAVYGLWDERDWWFLRRVMSFTAVRSEVTLVREPAPPPPWPMTGIRLAEPGDMGRFGKVPLSRVCSVPRDGRLMAFRHTGPWQGDTLAILDGAEIRGHVTVRQTGDSRVILDLCVPEGDDAAAQAIIRAAIGDGQQRLVAPSLARSPWFLVLQRAGFRVLTEDGPYLVLRTKTPRANSDFLAENWDATAADLGLRPMPPLLVPEEVITPPPIGTESARERHA